MKKFLLLVFLVQMSAYGCTRKENIVAYVGRRKVTVDQFRKRVKELPDYYLGFIATEGGKRQYLSGLIKEEILLLKCKEFNLDKNSDVIKRINDAKRDILLAAIVTHLQLKVIHISDQDIRDYYEENKDNFANPKQVKISHILLSDEKTAREVLNEFKKGVTFEKLAREYSIDTVTAINGGDLGYFGKGEMFQPEFENEVFKLKKVGQISDIIKTPFGYHIAKLTGRRRGREKTFEESKDEIKMKLEKEKFHDIIEGYRNEYSVRVNYDVLDELEIIEETKTENVE